MTNRATLEALLARVLEGTGPDRELDFAIAAAFGWPDSPNLHQHARRYTESLDSALTLVPEGYWWQISNGKRRHYDPQAGAELFFDGGPNRGDMAFTADAATPPLALIAACLKARMEGLGE